jgi:hypothetical protein
LISNDPEIPRDEILLSSRRILSGDQGMIVWWSIGAGVHVEPHTHANEQIVWMLKGKMEPPMSTLTTVSCDPIATSPRSGAKPSAVQDRKRSGQSTRSDRVAGGRKRVDASKRADTRTVASKKTLRSPSSKEHRKVHRSSQSSPHPIREGPLPAAAGPATARCRFSMRHRPRWTRSTPKICNPEHLGPFVFCFDVN